MTTRSAYSWGDAYGGLPGPASLCYGGVARASLTLGDFNGDGKLDLATGNFDAGTVSVLLGNGEWLLQAQSGLRRRPQPPDARDGRRPQWRRQARPGHWPTWERAR